MTADQLLDEEPRRALWLITLADVMLLLVGFFVFLQANTTLDPKQIASGLREGFGLAADAPIALEANAVTGFAPGSASPPTNDIASWAELAMRDPRTVLRVTGGTDGSPQDVDEATGSSAILAADRARAVAAALLRDVPAARIIIDTRPGAGRAVQLTIAFAGETK